MNQHAPRGIAEMMMRSDAPVALASSLERRVLDMYRTAQGAFRSYAVTDTVPDLRDVQNLRLDTSDTLDRLGEREEYRDGKFTETSSRIRVVKYGKILNITKEMRLNDDTRAVFRLAEQYGRIAARTEAAVAPALLDAIPVTADALGPIAGALDETLIERMFQVFWDRETADGKKIEVDPAILVYHPTHRVALDSIFRPSTAGDYNPLSGWLPSSGMISERYVVTRSRLYLMAAPAEWPTIEVDFLRSRIDPREDYSAGPRVFSDGFTTIPLMPGDIGAQGAGFRFDTMQFKVTHFLGGARVDPDELGVVVANVQ
jgi:hypothetical protein